MWYFLTITKLMHKSAIEYLWHVHENEFIFVYSAIRLHLTLKLWETNIILFANKGAYWEWWFISNSLLGYNGYLHLLFIHLLKFVTVTFKHSGHGSKPLIFLYFWIFFSGVYWRMHIGRIFIIYSISGEISSSLSCLFPNDSFYVDPNHA